MRKTMFLIVFAAFLIFFSVPCTAANSDWFNSSVDRCNDFFEYACGRWPQTYGAHDNNNFVQLKNFTETKVFDALRNGALRNTNGTNVARFVDRFYHDCLQIDQWSSRGLQPLLKLIHSTVGEWPLLRQSVFQNLQPNWSQMFSHIFTETELSPIFLIDVQNYANVYYLVIKPHQTGLDHHILLDPISNHKQIESYKQYIRNTAILLGAPNDEQLTKDIFDLVEFETQLAKLEEKTISHQRFIEIASFAALNLGTENHIDWLELVNTIMHKLGSDIQKFKLNDKIAVENFDNIREVVNLLAKTPTSVIQNLFAWLVAMNYGGFTTQSFRANKVIFNQYESDYYEKYNQIRCQSYVQYYWPWVIDRLMVDLLITENAIQTAQEMTQEIKVAFAELMQHTEWLDESTKSYAIKKLDAVVENVGYPTWIKSDQALDHYYDYLKNVHKEKGQFLEMIASVHALSKVKEFTKLQINYTSMSWQGSLFEANAYYNHYKNWITIPAILMQWPLLGPNRSASMNYGALGTLIGHEFVHGFDNYGRHFDLNGEATEWWDEETVTRFHEKTKCLKEQYGTVVDPLAQMKINGEQTLEENIADNGGVKIAHKAFLNHQTKHGKMLTRIESEMKFSSEQLFFVSYAMTWCNSVTKEGQIRTINRDSHAPNRYRVNLVLANYDSFSKAFACPTGTPMNPGHKCSVW